MLFLKRALLMLGGALLVIVSVRNLALTIIDPSMLAMPPANDQERAGMIFTSFILAGAGAYLFVRGKRLELPKEEDSTDA